MQIIQETTHLTHTSKASFSNALESLASFEVSLRVVPTSALVQLKLYEGLAFKLTLDIFEGKNSLYHKSFRVAIDEPLRVHKLTKPLANGQLLDVSCASSECELIIEQGGKCWDAKTTGALRESIMINGAVDIEQDYTVRCASLKY